MGVGSSSLGSQKIEIPKIIHFIWAGGSKLMPVGFIRVVLEWAQVNIPDGFSIYLWVDKETFPGGMKKLATACKKLFNQQAKKVNFKYTIDFDDENSNFKLMDIENEGVCDEIVRYEINKPRPNYGASSDRLRYRICERIGGAYFDGDVRPSKAKRLAEHPVFKGELKKHIFMYSTCSQGFENAVGNDAFICSRNNPLMKKILAMVEDNYLRSLFETNMGLAIDEAYFSDSPQYIRVMTMTRTGPGVVRKVVETGSYSCDLYSIDILLNQEIGSNTHHWLGVPLRKCDSLESAIKIIQDAIAFEAQHFCVLKLDEHVENLKQMITESELNPIKPKKIVWHVVTCALDVLAFQRAKVIQLTLTNKYTLLFCTAQNILPMTFIVSSTNPDYHKNIIKAITRDYRLHEFDELALAASAAAVPAPKIEDFVSLCNDMCMMSTNIFNLAIKLEESVNDLTTLTIIRDNLNSLLLTMVSYTKTAGSLKIENLPEIVKLQDNILIFKKLIKKLEEKIKNLNTPSEQPEEERTVLRKRM